MAYKDKRELAKVLYVHNSWNQNKIAETLKVTEKTVRTWKKSDNWDHLKSAVTTTTTNVITNLLEIMEELSERLRDKTRDGKLQAADAQNLLNIQKTVKELRGNLTFRDHIEALDGFTNYILDGPLYEFDKSTRDKMLNLMGNYVNHLSNKFSEGK